MVLHFCGYLPKRATLRPPDYDLPGVVEISSVSNCMAKSPDIEVWLLNEIGFLAEAVAAEGLIPDDQRPEFDVYGYSVLGECFENGVGHPWAVPTLDCSCPGDDFEVLGFDAVSRTGSHFECSPLSCNGAAKRYRANVWCLFDTLEEAILAARDFSSGNWEPGTYYVIEVQRRRRRTSR